MKKQNWQIRNPKSEILNKFEYQNPNVLNRLFGIWKIGKLGFVSNFEIRISYLIIFIILYSILPVFAQSTDTCLLCHQELDGKLKVSADEIKSDIHFTRGLNCTSCHGGDNTKEEISESMDPAKGFSKPPARNEIPNFCARCHSDPDFMRAYNPNIPMDQLSKYNASQHGKLNRQGDLKVAVCTTCHGYHGIRTKSDPLSKSYILNVPGLCSRCHSDKEYMKEYDIPTNQMEEYEQSVHGEALLKKGDRAAASCNSCHGSHDAILPRTGAVGNVCAQCHSLSRDLFVKSPHKAAHEKLNLPECEVCHGNHKILRPDDSMVGVGSASICLTCHQENTAGYNSAKSMRDSLEALKAKINTAQDLVKQAGELGMDISDAEYEINEASHMLIKSRSYVHSFSAKDVEDIASSGLESANKAREQGLKAIKEYNFRRKGYLISVVIILLIALLLFLKIKELAKKRKL